MGRVERGRPRLALRDEPRALALLATAYERAVEAGLLAKLRRAASAGPKARKRSPIFVWPMPACRSARKSKRCVSSWRTNSLMPGSHPPPAAKTADLGPRA